MNNQDDDDDTDGTAYELEMPFVTVTSVGGPHDDESYAAGWEMGNISTRLKLAREMGLGLPMLCVNRDNLPQIDLVAMKYGIAFSEVHHPHLDAETNAQWAHIKLVWTS